MIEETAIRNTPPRSNNDVATETNLEEPLIPPVSIEPRIVDGLPSKISVLVKSLYFLDALGSSSWGRYSAIYYNLHGLNSQHIGLIEGLRTAIPTLSIVLWGIVADRFQSRKKVWLITNSVSTSIQLTLALPFIYSSFTRILCVSILAQLFVSSGVLDAYTLDLLGPVNKIFYGRYRLYASLSWGIGSIIMGWVTDHYGFEPNFIMFGLLGFLMVILVATQVPEIASSCDQSRNEESNDNDDDEEEPERIKELVLLAIRPRVLIFLLEVIIMGAGMATVERLLFLFLVNDLGASTLLCGLTVGVNVLFELPIFWYASQFMAVLGHDGMFLLSMTCFTFRVWGYTLLTPSTKWFVLLLEIMHGITFACFWVVSTDISKTLVDQTKGAYWSTTIPSSVQMLYSSVGVSLGSIIGGWAMNHYSSKIMYQCTASIVFGALLLHIAGSVTSRMCCNGESFLPNYKASDEEDDDAEEDSVVSQVQAPDIDTDSNKG